MDNLNLWSWKDKIKRMELKAWISILGIFWLLIVFMTGLMFARIMIQPVQEPVARNLFNVWIIEVEEDKIHVFEEGQEKIYEFGEGVMVADDCREQVADIRLVDERVSQVVCKTHKINGKVLSVDEKGVELSGIGYLPFAKDQKGYRLYGKLSVCEPKDVLVGYDFADFVMENGEICAVLMVKEAAMEYIRVLISTDNYEGMFHERVEFTCDTDFVVEYGGDEDSVEKLFKAYEICTIGEESFGLSEELEEQSDPAQIRRICIKPMALTGKVILENVQRHQGTPAYRGVMELISTSEGIAVINEVLLEEYLYSVVPSEMPASYPVEALRAQAICARTYAYKYMLHAGLGEYGAHVNDSTEYQVYNNIEEQETATAAVKETMGQILFDEEGKEPANTYYYSTSCGIGTNADIWNPEKENSPEYLTPRPILRTNSSSGNELMQEGLLRAQELTQEHNFAEFIHAKQEEDYEAAEPWYRWTYIVRNIDISRMYERLKSRYEADPGRVLTQNKKGKYQSSPIKEWEDIRSIRIVSRGLGGVVKEMELETDNGVYKVLKEYNIRYILCDAGIPVYRQDGSEAKVLNLLPSGYFVVDTLEEEDGVTGYILHGGGYGHGVGMSQNGARSMALEGLTAEEILIFFYQGCLITNIYKM